MSSDEVDTAKIEVADILRQLYNYFSQKVTDIPTKQHMNEVFSYLSSLNK